MDFMIFDSAGNAVESFASDREAIRALVSMTEAEPEAAMHLAILVFDDEGDAVGDPLTVADVRPDAVTRLVMSETSWELRGNLTVMRRWSDAAAASAPREVLGAC
ncbi:MAG TPA: hypothetical protein VH276_05875 [Solirubrobacteraceae bacterium]|jgi:hypothetical protein|nr:hypothetical protein [Solirubrobacteraceae bacterium]